MPNEPKYSPVLWSALVIPVISGTELFVDSVTWTRYPFFVLSFFYIVSVRYSLAVCLGVFAHDAALKSSCNVRAGAWLWLCYFLMLVFCSLLVPGAAIFGLATTLVLTFVVLALSVAQGILSLRFAQSDEPLKKDIKWRIGFDLSIVGCLIYEISDGTYQLVFFLLFVLCFMDFTVSDFAKQTLKEMTLALRDYFRNSMCGGPGLADSGGDPP